MVLCVPIYNVNGCNRLPQWFETRLFVQFWTEFRSGKQGNKLMVWRFQHVCHITFCTLPLYEYYCFVTIRIVFSTIMYNYPLLLFEWLPQIMYTIWVVNVVLCMYIVKSNSSYNQFYVFSSDSSQLFWIFFNF